MAYINNNSNHPNSHLHLNHHNKLHHLLFRLRDKVDKVKVNSRAVNKVDKVNNKVDKVKVVKISNKLHVE